MIHNREGVVLKSHYRALVKNFVPISSIFAIALNFTNVGTWWSTAGTLCQDAWNQLLDHIGDDYFTAYISVPTVLTLGVYWTVGTVFTVFDVTGWQSHYKVQPHAIIDLRKTLKALLVVLVNQLVVSAPFAYLAHLVVCYRGMPSPRQLPSFARLITELPLQLLIYEIDLYYIHRFLHHRLLYKHIHKQHHEWKAPMALVANYCHPLEHLVSNLLPITFGVGLLGSHALTAWLWFIYFILTALYHHSGYNGQPILAFLPPADHHDFHHLSFNNCYGPTGILDRFHGTDAEFIKYRKQKENEALQPGKSY